MFESGFTNDSAWFPSLRLSVVSSLILYAKADTYFLLFYYTTPGELIDNHKFSFMRLFSKQQFFFHKILIVFLYTNGLPHALVIFHEPPFGVLLHSDLSGEMKDH